MKEEEYNSLIVSAEKLVSYICDLETYEVYYMTPSALKLYGLTDRNDYEGKQCYRVLQGLDSPCPFCTGDIEEGHSCRREYYNEQLKRWLEAEVILEVIDGRRCRLEIVRDITAQKKQLKELSKQLTVEETLIECIQTLIKEMDLQAALSRFLEIIGHYYAAGRSYVYEIDREKNVGSNTFEWCASQSFSKMERYQNIPLHRLQGLLNELEKKGECYCQIKRETSEEMQTLFERAKVCSIAVAPLIKEGTVIGFLGVDNPKKNVDNLVLLRSIAGFVLEELERRRLLQALEYTSYTDLLTGMGNRNQYMKVMKQYEQKKVRTLGIIFVDINGLKEINDTRGHQHGDSIIIQTASILRETNGTYMFRVGGDEFIVFFENITKEEFQELISELREKFNTNGECDVSIGCSWRAGEFSVEKEILRADELMYVEKQSYYSAVLRNGRRIARTGMASEALQEIADDCFEVFLQPQVKIKTGEIFGAEALVRKKDGEGGYILPDHFLPFYEREGVIRHVDFYVLDRVCKLMKEWRTKEIDLNISVNFSRITLMEPNVLNEIKDVCRKYEVQIEKLTIEVTESTGKIEFEQLKKLIHDIKKEGFSVSLDDFGSKYSNLSILTSLEFDEIKFDKLLIDELAGNDRSRIVIKNTIQMCQDLKHIKSIAEGIETKEQLRLLNEYSCECGQGFYFSKPLPIDQFEAMFREKEGHL